MRVVFILFPCFTSRQRRIAIGRLDLAKSTTTHWAHDYTTHEREKRREKRCAIPASSQRRVPAARVAETEAIDNSQHATGRCSLLLLVSDVACHHEGNVYDFIISTRKEVQERPLLTPSHLLWRLWLRSPQHRGWRGSPPPPLDEHRASRQYPSPRTGPPTQPEAGVQGDLVIETWFIETWSIWTGSIGT